MWRSFSNFLSHLANRNPKGWYPLLCVYYLTYACDFRCFYCSDGNGTPYFELADETLPGSRVLDLLHVARRSTDYLVITGGEPLLHPEFDYVLEHLPSIGFDGVILTTNGWDLIPHLPSVNASVQHLVFSLDTLDPDKAQRWYGRGPGVLDRILRSIEAAARLPGRKYEILISSVATPTNIEDLAEVYRFCRESGYRFALCPQLVGVKPHPELFGNTAYQRLYDHLIMEKRLGRRVNGSIPYLEHMRDLKKFRCRPSTVLAISPSGDVFYPCLERGHVAGNLLQTPDLHGIRAQGRACFGPDPVCDNRCHSACALGFSLILNEPLSLVKEAWLMAKGGWRQRRDDGGDRGREKGDTTGWPANSENEPTASGDRV